MPISGVDIASSNAYAALDKIKALELRVARLESERGNLWGNLASAPSYPDCEGCKTGLSLACDNGGPWYHMATNGVPVPHRQPT